MPLRSRRVADYFLLELKRPFSVDHHKPIAAIRSYAKAGRACADRKLFRDRRRYRAIEDPEQGTERDLHDREIAKRRIVANPTEQWVRDGEVEKERADDDRRATNAVRQRARHRCH